MPFCIWTPGGLRYQPSQMFFYFQSLHAPGLALWWAPRLRLELLGCKNSPKECSDGFLGEQRVTWRNQKGQTGSFSQGAETTQTTGERQKRTRGIINYSIDTSNFFFFFYSWQNEHTYPTNSLDFQKMCYVVLSIVVWVWIYLDQYMMGFFPRPHTPSFSVPAPKPFP